MAEAKKKCGTTKRFGARYGTRVRDRLAVIEALYKGKSHKCPYCNYQSVKRKAAGIWECNKCCSTYTSRAYTAGKASSIFEKEAIEEEKEVEQ